GVDASNLELGQVTLLPVDPDKSARRLQRRIRQLTGRHPAVIISDTFGRPWRVGQVNMAIGVAGMLPIMDYRGEVDQFGNPLKATAIAVADELASAAELVMGKVDGVPAAVVRGVRFRKGRGKARALVRSPNEDLFR
ncbi:MAG: coenzyme F420-0:L-glutamate ligase, partial [Candidatus Methylomirabilales bacterium]